MKFWVALYVLAAVLFAVLLIAIRRDAEKSVTAESIESVSATDFAYLIYELDNFENAYLLNRKPETRTRMLDWAANRLSTLLVEEGKLSDDQAEVAYLSLIGILQITGLSDMSEQDKSFMGQICEATSEHLAPEDNPLVNGDFCQKFDTTRALRDTPHGELFSYLKFSWKFGRRY